MIILSLNARGLGGASKKNSLKRLITNINPTVLLIQEITMEGKTVEEAINECAKDWKMQSINTEGNSRGILTAWIPMMNMISTTRYGLVLGTLMEDKETRLSYTILNIYGNLYDRKMFWEFVGNSGALEQTNVIMG